MSKSTRYNVHCIRSKQKFHRHYYGEQIWVGDPRPVHSQTRSCLFRLQSWWLCRSMSVWTLIKPYDKYFQENDGIGISLIDLAKECSYLLSVSANHVVDYGYRLYLIIFIMNESNSNSNRHSAVTAEGHKLSMEIIIEKVRDSRNDLIKELLREGKIQSYFLSTYNKEISPVKVEFVRRELKSLSMTPVDLIHYAALIKAVRKANDFDAVGADNHLFYQELEVIFRRYNY